MINEEFNLDEFIDVRVREAVEEARDDANKISLLKRIYDIIEDNIEDGFNNEAIVNKLVKKFDLTEITAEKYIDSYREGSLGRRIKEMEDEFNRK